MNWSQRWHFLREYIKNPRQIGAITPSSRWLVQALLTAAPVEQAQVVVELGAGTGVVTDAILKRLPANGRLFVFENEPLFLHALQQRVHDERVTWCGDSAIHLAQVLQDHTIVAADRIISELPFNAFDPAVRAGIMRAICNSMNSNSIFVTFQYTPLQNKLFRTWFTRSCISSIVWLNLPPAAVYQCRI